jgi:uncharacterized protein (TIGR02118 family)
MARMVVVYNQPKNPEAFNKHYFEIHLPLAKKIPGLQKYEISQGPVISPTGHSAYLIAVLYFENMAALKAGFASPEGQACAEDRKQYASNEDVQMFLYESKVL